MNGTIHGANHSKSDLILNIYLSSRTWKCFRLHWCMYALIIAWMISARGCSRNCHIYPLSPAFLFSIPSKYLCRVIGIGTYQSRPKKNISLTFSLKVLTKNVCCWYAVVHVSPVNTVLALLILSSTFAIACRGLSLRTPTEMLSETMLINVVDTWSIAVRVSEYCSLRIAGHYTFF